MRTSSPFAILTLAVSLQTLGCVSYGSATAPEEPHFEPLRQGRIAAFEQRLKADLQTGATTDETRIGLAWMEFLTCRPVSDYRLSTPEARWALALLKVEEARRATYVLARASTPAELTDLPYGTMANPDGPLSWEPGELAREGAIVWPAEDEDWADEFAAAAPVESECDELPERLKERPEGSPDDEVLENGFGPSWRYYIAQFRALDDAHREAARADEPMGDGARRLELEARIYEYVVVDQLVRYARRQGTVEGVDGKTRDAVIVPDSLVEQADRNLREALAGAASPDDEASEAYRNVLATAHYILAVDAFEDDDFDLARDQLDRSLDVGAPEPLVWPVRHLSLWLTWESGDWDAIAAQDDELPPSNHPDYGSYLYRKATALLRAGQPDRFLAVVTTAMADRDWNNDPFLEATWATVLEYLAEVPFDPRVVELVENLGPRTRTYERMEELGRTALDVGRPEVADDAATWLLARDTDARHHPRYFALRAMADFLRDDPAGFTEEIRRITRRDADLLEALPASRRARFFEHADRELARIMAQAMPMMAEWGDDAAARESRRQWLTLMVEEIQRFLRSAEETAARSQLVELYRLAGTLLADHPRGYAERVGRDEDEPLVLGTVRVDPSALRDEASLGKSLIPVSDFLAPIPRDAPVGAWDDSWPALGWEDQL